MATPPKVLIVDDNKELLDLLTRLFDDAGYAVLPAGRGKAALELARAEKPSLAIIDILLPDMMGYHLAEGLKMEREIPVIFITGVFKGGKHAQEAKTQHGAVAYLEKPFDAHRLLDIARGIVKPAPVAAPPPSPGFAVELDIDVEEERPQDPMELTGLIRIAGDNVSAELKGARLLADGGKPGAAALVRPPPSDYPASPPPIAPADRGIRRGELRENLPALINAFYQSQQTGELGAQRGRVKKVIFFERGRPVFAASNLVTDRFGQFMVRVGKINEAQLKEAAAIAASTKKRTGEVLVDMGLLRETERLYYVGQQIKSIIYSLFGWEEGVYELAFRESALQESIKLDLHPANLIVRGVKKLYKPERLRRLLAPEDRVLPSVQPVYSLEEIEIENWEAELLPKIDGTRTIAELVALANKPEPVVLGFIYALVALTILERRA